MTYYKEHPEARYAADNSIKIDRLVKLEALIPIGPCEHGRWDGHWPKGKCHCGHKTALTDVAPNIGVWQTAWVTPNEREWRPCWHEPWCDGANLRDKQGKHD